VNGKLQYVRIYRYVTPKCGAGAQLHKMGGVKSQPLIFGSSAANDNSHKKYSTAANALV